MPKPALQAKSMPPYRVESSRDLRVTFGNEAIKYFDLFADNYQSWHEKMDPYIRQTSSFLAAAIPKGKNILMVGGLSHEILESLDPSLGLGLHISSHLVEEMRRANTRKNISYYCALPEHFASREKFDYVLVLNLVDYAQDIFMLVDTIKRFTNEDSKVIFSTMNPVWDSFARLASLLKIRIPDSERNLVAGKVLGTALEIKNFRLKGLFRRVIFPRNIPFLTPILNQYLARLPILNALCFTQYVFASPGTILRNSKQTCSVIIPCYNEEGNIAECIERVPNMGAETEVVVVDDGSRDRTKVIVEQIAKHQKRVQLVTYSQNRGKGLAVLEGLKRCRGDICIILDADMTVPPEELTEFFEAIESRKADFVSGTRFVYPMEKNAMRIANFFGNILFSKLVEIISGSKCSDTLCGTKALRRSDFTHFKLEDSSWGDFDFIFHAAKLKLSSVEIPVHYKSRVAGESKMKAFSAGWNFLKLCLKKWSEIP